MLVQLPEIPTEEPPNIKELVHYIVTLEDKIVCLKDIIELIKFWCRLKPTWGKMESWYCDMSTSTQNFPPSMSVKIEATLEDTSLWGWLRDFAKRKLIDKCVCSRLLTLATCLAHKSPFIFMQGMRIEWYDVLHNRINVQTNRRKGSSLQGSGWQHCWLSLKSLINPNIGFSNRSMCRAYTSSNTVTANTVQRCGYCTRVHTVALMLQSHHQVRHSLRHCLPLYHNPHNPHELYR